MYINNQILKVAIVALTRGYEGDLDKYEDLINRNKSIYEYINSKIAFPFEMILFHEGNIPLNDQKFIQKKSQSEITFVNVESIFKKYINVDGYTIMCKFQMYYIWDYVKNYDYIIRIDEDIIIKNFNLKSIDKMHRKNIDFYFSKLIYESHVPTNDTLPLYLMKLFNAKNTKFYNHLFPYTNFYISKVKIWREETINNKLKNLAENNIQIINRWGDLPVIGSFINQFDIKSKRLYRLIYFHSSHKLLIQNNLFSPLQEYLNFKRLFILFPKLLYILKKIYRLFK